MQSIQSAVVMLFMVFIQNDGRRITWHCGVPSVGHQAYMKNSSTNRWPWHAAIFHIGENSVPQYRCGGTVLTSDSILTAGHCVTRQNGNETMSPKLLSISLGMRNLDDNDSSVQSFEVAQIRLHPNYIGINLSDDIAIIRLSTNVTFNNYVRPICLWPSNKHELSAVIDKVGTMVGWGRTETGEISNDLRKASMTVLSVAKCLESNRLFFGERITNSNFCASFRNGTSVCEGIAGGSITFIEDGFYYIRGIVSIAPAIIDHVQQRVTCDGSENVLFTDVAKYLPWISTATAS